MRLGTELGADRTDHLVLGLAVLVYIGDLRLVGVGLELGLRHRLEVFADGAALQPGKPVDTVLELPDRRFKLRKAARTATGELVAQGIELRAHVGLQFREYRALFFGDVLEDDILQVGHEAAQPAIGYPKPLDRGDEFLRLSMVALRLSSQFVIDPLLEQWVDK